MNKEKIEFIMIFFLILGFSGAPGSFPNLLIFCCLIPIDRNKKRLIHQIIRYNTIPLEIDNFTPVLTQLVFHKSP